MWRRFVENFKATLARGTIIRRDLPEEIHSAEEESWNADSVRAIRQDVQRFFRDVSGLLNILIVLVVAPLVPGIIISAVHNIPPWVYYLYALWVTGLAIAAAIVAGNAIALVPYVQKLPDRIYHELLWPVWWNVEFANIAICIGLIVYIVRSWNALIGHPFVILVTVLWLFAPWAAYLLRQVSLFVWIRIAQLVALMLLGIFSMASPIPMKYFQWAAQHDLANTLRPIEQQEITKNWATLQWFTPEGAPNVWYSSSEDHSYHLFAAPGHDPETNQELQPVTDEVTKNLIVANFLAEKERDKTELHEKLIHEYVSPDFANGASKNLPVALIVLNAQQQEDSALTERISKSLNVAGLSHQMSVFTPAFISSSLFQDIFAGQVSSDRPFHAENFASHLLVIQVGTTLSQEQPVQSVQMLAADTVWNVRLISPASGKIEYRSDIKERGAGFKEADAESNATERAETQLKKLIPDLSPLL